MSGSTAIPRFNSLPARRAEREFPVHGICCRQNDSLKDADEAVVTQRFVEDFRLSKAGRRDRQNDRVSGGAKRNCQYESAEEEPVQLLWLAPGQEAAPEAGSGAVVAKTFRIAGVLNSEIKEGAGQGGLRGLLPGADIYIPLRRRTNGQSIIAGR